MPSPRGPSSVDPRSVKNQLAAQAYLLLRKQRAAAGPPPSPNGLSARERLHALVEQLSESDAEKVLEVIDPDGDGLPTR
jgi:hypothetical protein